MKANQTNSSSKAFVLFAAVLSVGSFAYLFSVSKPKFKYSRSDLAPVNYEMAKVAVKFDLYSLDGREVNSTYEKIAEEKVAAQVADKKIAKNDKKNDKADKKIADAKKTSSVQTAQDQQKKSAQAKYSFYAKQAQVAQQNAKLKNSNTDKNLSTPKVSPSVNSQAFAPQVVANQNVPVKNPQVNVKDEEKNIKSIAIWKSEILADQSKEVILKFSAAYKKGEVKENDFSQLTSELTTSQDEKLIGLGLYALRANPSYTSYSRLIKLQAQVNSSYAGYIEETLLSYNQALQLPVLKQGLEASDKQVVVKTLEIVALGLNKIQNGQSSELVDSRYRRIAEAKDSTLTQYLILVTSLSKIIESNDPDLVKGASQNLELISSQNVAGI